MPSLQLGNLSNPLLSGVSSVANIMMLFGRSVEEWDITEASFNGVRFHVFEQKDAATSWNGAVGKVTDKGGRRKVKLLFPYRDGMTTDDLGRAPESFDIDVVLFGPDYKKGMQKLFEQLQQPTAGTLIHPVRGSVQCVMESFEITHGPEQSNAAAIHLSMIEHNFTIGDFSQLRSKKTSSLSNAISKALAAFTKIENAINQINAQALLAQSIKTLIQGQIEEYRNGYSNSLSSINRVFNPSGFADIGVLLPVNEGGLRTSGTNALSTTGTTSNTELISDTFVTSKSPSDPFAKVPINLLSNETQKAIAAIDVEKQVNSTRSQLQIVLRTMSEAGLVGTNPVSVSESGDPVLSGIDNTGSLDFYEQIVDLKQTALDLQTALETGISSSRVRILTYVVPRLMSIREVAFANGIDVEQVNEIDLLNPELPSVNYIAKDTEILVPV